MWSKADSCVFPVGLSFPWLMSVLLFSQYTRVFVYVCVLTVKPFTFDQTEDAKITGMFIA